MAGIINDVILFGLAFFAALPPSFLERLPHICLVKMLFGFCPADGTIRALSYFLHGDLSSALNTNMNVLIVFPLVVYLIGSRFIILYTRIRGESG